MDKKILIILTIIIVALAGVCAYFFINQGPDYKNITMNGINFEVPDSEVNISQQSDLCSMYNDTENGTEIIVFDSENAGFNDMSEAIAFAAIRDICQQDAQAQSEDGISFNYSESLEEYTYLGNFTHKNIFIVSRDKDTLKHMIETMHVDESVSINDTQTNTTENTTQTTTKKSNKNPTTSEEDTYQREEDKVIDGWDPKEHEVSREDLGEGYQRVDYDDGYHRIVNSHGDVESYGY